ncbi:MAG: DNA replication and repair protein RecF [Firmicutes bacterium]|nr:DNA replication and repair protein RecF [Bacillota bacterium]
MAPAHLERLFVRNFRSYAELTLEFAPGLNVFIGPNGAGKTNILEAVHYLGLGQSFRTARDAEAVRWEEAGFYLKGRRRDELGLLDIEVAYRAEGGKAVRVGGRTLSRLSELFGTLPCVVFTPDELAWLKGPPSVRRRWLDHHLAQVDPTYAERLGAFRDSLAQRNEVLAGLRGARSSALLEVWTEQYLDTAAEVAAARVSGLAEIEPLLREELERVAPGEAAALALQPAAAPGARRATGAGERPQGPLRLDAAPRTAADWRRWYGAELAAAAEEEALHGRTLVGPHRDDLAALLSGRDARRYASQGQQRSFVLALKIAEVRRLTDALRRAPLLLLDDIFSELDPDRRRRLTWLVEGRLQAFLTTTELALVPREAAARVFHVGGGRAEPLEEALP